MDMDFSPLEIQSDEVERLLLIPTDNRQQSRSSLATIAEDRETAGSLRLADVARTMSRVNKRVRA